MPCYAWGIPAESCRIGSELTAVEGSVCQHCYAFKGHYLRSQVQEAYQRRLTRSTDPQWIEAMVKLVYWQATETGVPYFRWFDSGDLQGVEMLRNISAVARDTPEIRHWLSTREYGIAQEYLSQARLPWNLTVRVSAPLVDGNPPYVCGLPTSTVHSSPDRASGFFCPAYRSKPANCGSCRACWDKGVENVSYPLH